MHRKFGVIAGLVLAFAVLLTVTGTSQSSDSTLIGETRVLDANRAGAAADVLSNRWFAAEPFAFAQVSASTLFSGNSIPGDSTFQARRRGLTTQLARIIATGDPVIGAPLAGSEQAYADAAANFTSFPIERRYVWGLAAVLGASGGFAIVPGGPAEALNRITTCLAGSIQTNQGGLAAGVALDCSAEPVRRALADLIAPGFFVGFGGNPAISASLTCSALLGNATGGSNSEIRWAYGKAYVLKGCDSAASIAAGGGSYELRQAAVAFVAAAGGSSGSTSNEEKLANAWAAGLADAFTVDVNPLTCAITTAAHSNLAVFSVGNLGLPQGAAAVAPFARFFANNSGNCSPIAGAVAGDNTELVLTIEGPAGAGSSLPLMSFVLSAR